MIRKFGWFWYLSGLEDILDEKTQGILADFMKLFEEAL